LPNRAEPGSFQRLITHNSMSLIGRLRTIFTMGRGMATGLSELKAGPDPIALFADWFAAARRSGIFLPESMALATSTPDGVPSARMMLLKGFGDDGFAFYTNYESRKGTELLENPRAAIVMHWPILERQVRVEGMVEKLPLEESEAYFETRPRGSQLGAWASQQSAELESRREMERRYREHEAKFAPGDVPLPPFWGGFRLVPQHIEFWQGRLNRLHDRLRYTREGDGWTVTRLYP
jgi:pyridoxamine 5'-phosphate oxidase